MRTIERVQTDNNQKNTKVLYPAFRTQGWNADMVATGNGQIYYLLAPARVWLATLMSFGLRLMVMVNLIKPHLWSIPASDSWWNRWSSSWCPFCSIDAGKATNIPIMFIEERYYLCQPRYWGLAEGMIIANPWKRLLTVNITKAKQMTNVRSATKDQQRLSHTSYGSLKESLSSWTTMSGMEVTPESIRLKTNWTR